MRIRGITVHHGDSRDVLKTLPDNSIDSVVTDPPYALVSIVKRFGSANAAPATGNEAYARASAGFMGKTWDTGETAFAVEFWAEVFRVLKPGGHLIAASGTRTYHRLAVAIEDAGFEVRDMISWLYGSGFPKSHDVSKGIDKRKDWTALPKLQGAIKAARKAIGISQSEAARRVGLIGHDENLGGGGFMWFETGMRAPTREQWPKLKAALSLGDEFDSCFEEVEREVTGTVDEWSNRTNYALTSKDGLRRDKPASEAAITWAGWGTALKPACEPWVLARKPLSGTVAANVLAHGTGALNIDACRIEAEAWSESGVQTGGDSIRVLGDGLNNAGRSGSHELGRWPANVIHDGSDEVVAAFPETTSGVLKAGTIRNVENAIYGKGMAAAGKAATAYDTGGDTGSAARFFYSAKADADDRLGSKHPTVKPVDLMRYLCRLVTPPGGVVLDPFAGSGSTGVAAMLEGFQAVLIERDDEYVADIHRKLAFYRGEGRLAAQEKKQKPQASAEGLPLFGGAE